MMCRFAIVWVALTVAKAWAETPTLADQLCARYDAIRTLACQSRKTTMAGDEGATLLSRVYYQQPEKLHVDNISPVRRRIVADGKMFYLHHANLSRGFARPIDKLEGEMRLMIGAIAATPLDALLRLRGKPETVLEPLSGLPVRRGYAADTNLFVVLNCDPTGRLARVDYFKSPAMESSMASTTYSQFQLVTNGCWLALRQQTTAVAGTNTITETRVFDAMRVNQPLDASLFDHNIHFKGIAFVSELAAME